MTHRIPFIYTLLLTIVSAAITYLLITHTSQTLNTPPETLTSHAVYTPQGFTIQRLKGFNYIEPLVSAESENKAEAYNPLTQKIAAYIESKKQSRDIVNAAFYLKDLNNSQWTGYNENDQYSPGSLIKVAILITYLRMEEKTPGKLNEQYFYSNPFPAARNAWIKPEKELQPGRSYTVKELLTYMITYSDNQATAVLNTHLQFTDFAKVFTDLGLKLPVNDASDYPMSAKEYSVFMKAIYNAAYLTIPHSEFAAELLSKSVYSDGFKKGFPANIKFIHKFGESGTTEVHSLSESGIVYINEKAYELTVMSNGSDLTKLSAVIADIARMVYEQVSIL